jgi:hypothetical protein
MVIFVVLFWKNLPQSHVFLYGSPSIAGIATMLVNVRVGLGLAAGEEGRITRSLRDSAFVDPDDGFEDPGGMDESDVRYSLYR